MTALAVEHASISVLKLHIVVIKYFSVLFSFTYLPATHALRPYRIAALEPIDHIKIVYMLLGNMISAEPYKIIPVAHLVFHLCLSFLAWPHPYTIIVRLCLCRSDITNQLFTFK